MAIRPARQRLEIPAAEVPAEAPAAKIPAAEVAAAVVPVTGGIAAGQEGVGGKRLPEQKPGEQAGGEAEAAPVRRGEAGVDVADPAAVRLHLAHVGLDTLLDLVRAGGAGRDGAARPAFRG